MSDLSIKEVKQLKRDLEKHLLEKFIEFEDKTGVSITKVELLIGSCYDSVETKVHFLSIETKI